MMRPIRIKNKTRGAAEGRAGGKLQRTGSGRMRTGKIEDFSI